MVIKLLVFIQVALVNVTYILMNFFVKPDKYLWVIGVSETAQNVYRLGRVIHPSVTVSLSRRQKFYNYEHDYELGINIVNLMS
jgi:hypothetical protein